MIFYRCLRRVDHAHHIPHRPPGTLPSGGRDKRRRRPLRQRPQRAWTLRFAEASPENAAFIEEARAFISPEGWRDTGLFRMSHIVLGLACKAFVPDFSWVIQRKDLEKRDEITRARHLLHRLCALAEAFTKQTGRVYPAEGYGLTGHPVTTAKAAALAAHPLDEDVLREAQGWNGCAIPVWRYQNILSAG